MLLRLVKSSTSTTTTTFSHHISATVPLSLLRHFSNKNNNNSDDNWNDAWETAWLPEDTTTTTPSSALEAVTDIDPDSKAFFADMNDNWEQRRGQKGQDDSKKGADEAKKDENEENGGLYSLKNVKRDYRLKKQRIHAGLWVNEIDKLNESNLGVSGDTHDIDKLLDSCSEIFDTATNDVNNPKILSASEFKNKPDGWESMSKSEDASVWEMSQREEDILLQEFERRTAFCKFQIASFIKTHIFSRRRPIDGWKYMIEVIGPNAKKGTGSVSRLPSLADPATQAFTQDCEPTSGGRLTSPRRR